MKSVLITGANGFVGTNLQPYLASKGYELHPLSLRDSDWKSKANPDVDAVVHLAGLAHDLKGQYQPDDYFRVNAELTKELYDWYLSESKANKFIFISSVKAVADEVEGALKEDVLANPSTPFGKAKLQAEQYITSHAKEGKDFYILRPSMIHGPGNKGNLNLLYQIVKKGIPWPLAAFENKRSFLSVDNLDFVIDQLIEKPIASGVYHIADTEPISTNQLVGLINECLGRKPKLWKLSRKMITFGAGVGSALKAPFNKDRLKKLTESYVVDNHKILEAIQTQLPLTSSEGIKKTINSIK